MHNEREHQARDAFLVVITSEISHAFLVGALVHASCRSA
jgi:hypothetical protein